MEASRPAGPARPEGTNDGALGAAVFVWTLWAVMTAAAAYYVTACATNVPHWDEWVLVPLVTGREPLDVETLWQSVNEHRLPLIKLTLVGLVRATGDFRSQAWLNLALLSATAAGLVLAASHLRGRVAYSDAFFPVVLLHWGHFELYTGQITLNHTLASVLQLVVLAAVVLRPGGLNRAALAAVALCLVALPLCGANGLPVVLTAAAWLGWAAVWAWGEGRRGWALAHLAAAAAGAG